MIGNKTEPQRSEGREGKPFAYTMPSSR